LIKFSLYHALVDGNWGFNSDDALESQTYVPKNVGICYSNSTKKLSEPLLSRFRVIYLNEYSLSQFYEIVLKKLLVEGLDKKVADEIAISVSEQLPHPNKRNCVQIGRLVKNELNIETDRRDSELQRIR
jgi:hypothetical protein